MLNAGNCWSSSTIPRPTTPKTSASTNCLRNKSERTPDNVAVVFEGQQLTYAQLNARANQLAHHLQTLGVGPEVPVAICMERCPEMVVGVLGILKAGGAYLPLDPAYPKERLAFMLRRCPRAGGADARALAGEPARARSARRVPGLRAGKPSPRRAKRIRSAGATAKNLAYVIYTSGSTGQPKGVMGEHGGLSIIVYWVNESSRCRAEDSLSLTTPITFDVPGRELFPPLLRAEGCVICRRRSSAIAATAGGRRSAARGSRCLNCVPSLLRLLSRGARSRRRRSALRAVMCGGEALPTKAGRAIPAPLASPSCTTSTARLRRHRLASWLCEEINGRLTRCRSADRSPTRGSIF